jgi:hypothetical protein
MAKSQKSQFTGPAKKSIRRIEKSLKRGYNVLVQFTLKLNGKMRNVQHWIHVTVENVWAYVGVLIPSGHMIHKVRVLQWTPAV